MANGVYIGVEDLAKKIKDVYIGVEGVAKKVSKGYIGVDGVAKLFYQDRWLYQGYIVVGTQIGSTYYTQFRDPESGATIQTFSFSIPNCGFGTTPGKLYISGRNNDNSSVVYSVDPITGANLTSGNAGSRTFGHIAGTNNGELWVAHSSRNVQGDYQPKRMDPDTLAVIGTATISSPTLPGLDRYDWGYNPLGGTNGVVMVQCLYHGRDSDNDDESYYYLYDYDTSTWAAVNTPSKHETQSSYQIIGDMPTEEEIYGNFDASLWPFAASTGYGRVARLDRNSYAILQQYQQVFYAYCFGPKILR